MEPINNQLAETVRNLELATPELKQPKIGDPDNVVKFHNALQDVKIVRSSIEDIKSALKYAMVKIGLRAQNFPSEEEKAVLVDHVLRQYGGHTVQEIRLAFDMAIEGKIGVDANCYENFSCIYFSKIMSAYREYAKGEYRQLESSEHIKLLENKEDMSDQAMTDWLQAKRKDVLSGVCTVDFIPVMLYNWLDKKGGIRKTIAEKKEYLVKAVEHRQAQLVKAIEDEDMFDNRRLLESFMKMKDQGYFIGEEIDKLKIIAKKMIVFDLIKIDEPND